MIYLLTCVVGVLTVIMMGVGMHLTGGLIVACAPKKLEGPIPSGTMLIVGVLVWAVLLVVVLGSHWIGGHVVDAVVNSPPPPAMRAPAARTLSILRPPEGSVSALGGPGR